MIALQRISKYRKTNKQKQQKHNKQKYPRIIKQHQLKSVTSMYEPLYTFYKSDIYKVIKNADSINYFQQGTIQEITDL